jgi:hypothetical protein
MLRESAKVSSTEINLAGITDITVDTGVAGGSELIALTDAVVLRDSDELEIARSAASEYFGVAGTVRAIAVAANFMQMNIIMDTLGTRSHESLDPLASDLGLGQTHNN